MLLILIVFAILFQFPVMVQSWHKLMNVQRESLALIGYLSMAVSSPASHSPDTW